MGNNKLVAITLDKPRNLLFNMGAMSAYESQTGKSFLKIGETLSNLMVKDLQVLLWAGLLHEDKNLKLDMVGDMIGNISIINAVTSKIMEALTINNSDGDESKNAASPQS